MTLVVNGRFLLGAGTRATGVQRVARAFIDGARDAGTPLEVVAPPGADDPRIDRIVWAPPGRAGSHLWEQAVLPAVARGRPILSLANTAPLAIRRGAVYVHDLATLVRPEWFAPRFRPYGRLSLLAARRHRLVLTPSRAVRDELIARGVDPSRITAVRPAVDARFQPSAPQEIERVRAVHGLRKPYLVLVGWADPRKDAATAVAAHARAVVDAPHDLVLVGGAHPNFAPVTIPSSDSVRVTGSLDDADLVPLVSGAAAVVYPSRYEGFGLPPIEAIACGTPAIVTDIPVFHESVGDGGRFVPAGDVDAWAEAMRDALSGRLPVGTAPAWTWSDAAGALRIALGGAGLL